MDSTPLVSIITATYNRSNVLAYALESVRRQTLEDWEHLVIGDACTDDTEQVAQSFNDSRIRFVNLKKNCGEQSGPNNEGCRLSRGRFIAFLNHDDLWLPDHLEIALQALERKKADLIFTLLEAVNPDGGLDLGGGWGENDLYDPFYHIPASSWVFRRELIEAVGPWKFYKKCFNIPSQDWLFRAWKAGKNIRLEPELTVVAFQSAVRPGGYKNREYLENKIFLERIISEPEFREKELKKIALGYACRKLSDENHPLQRKSGGIKKRIRKWVIWVGINPSLVRRFIRKLILLSGVHPYSIINFVNFRRRGGVIAQLRKIRGLD